MPSACRPRGSAATSLDVRSCGTGPERCVADLGAARHFYCLREGCDTFASRAIYLSSPQELSLDASVWQAERTKWVRCRPRPGGGGGGEGDRQQPCQAQTWAVKQGARSRQPQAIDQAPAAVWPRHPPPSSKAPTPTPTDTHARKVVASHPVQSALFDYFPSLWHLAAACGGVL